MTQRNDQDVVINLPVKDALETPLNSVMTQRNDQDVVINLSENDDLEIPLNTLWHKEIIKMVKKFIIVF